MNIQGVCDSNLKFLNIVAKRTGSAHDAYICSNSGLNDILVNGTITDGWLLGGGSGYPLRPLLVTPILNPTSRAEERYNGLMSEQETWSSELLVYLNLYFAAWIEVAEHSFTVLHSCIKVCKIVVATSVMYVHFGQNSFSTWRMKSFRSRADTSWTLCRQFWRRNKCQIKIFNWIF